MILLQERESAGCFSISSGRLINFVNKKTLRATSCSFFTQSSFFHPDGKEVSLQRMSEGERGEEGNEASEGVVNADAKHQAADVFSSVSQAADGLTGQLSPPEQAVQHDQGKKKKKRKESTK